MRAGFLTSPSHLSNSGTVCLDAARTSARTVTSISSISQAASGSLAAVGGGDAIYDAGGRGGLRRSSSQFLGTSQPDSEQSFSEDEDLALSLPGTG